MSTMSLFATTDSPRTLTFPGKLFLLEATGSGAQASSLEASPELPEARPVTVDLTKGNAIPARVLLGSLQDYEHRLVSDIPLSVDVEEGVVSVTWDEIDEFGYGADLSTAIDDFRSSTIQLYAELHRDRDSLGQDLIRVYTVMQKYIAQRS